MGVIESMLGLLFGKVQTTLIAISTIAVFILGVFLYGVKTQRTRQKVRDLQSFKDTTDAINSVDTNIDRKSRVKRLHHNGIIR
jgi:CHASE3 domain sensor protein